MWEKAQNFYAPLLKFLSKPLQGAKSIAVGQEYRTVCIYLRRHLLFSQQLVNLSFFLGGKKNWNMSPPHFPTSLRSEGHDKVELNISKLQRVKNNSSQPSFQKQTQTSDNNLYIITEGPLPLNAFQSNATDACDRANVIGC